MVKTASFCRSIYSASKASFAERCKSGTGFVKIMDFVTLWLCTFLGNYFAVHGALCDLLCYDRHPHVF